MDTALQVVEDVKQYKVIQVIDETTRTQAASAIVELKSKRAEVVAYWKPLKENAHRAHQEIVSREKEMLKLVDGVITAFDNSIKSYLREQERIRIEAQRKLDEEARKAREEAEARIRAEQEKALAEGNVEKALEIEEKVTPLPVQPTIAPSQKTVKTDFGTATAVKETFVEVVDFGAFLKYCAANELFGFHDVKTGAVKTWVKQCGVKDVPGLRIYEDFATSYRAAR